MLEREEQPGDCPFLGAHRQQVDPVETDRTGHVVVVPPGEHMGERGLAGPVRSHDRVHLAGREGQVEAAQDRRCRRWMR